MHHVAVTEAAQLRLDLVDARLAVGEFIRELPQRIRIGRRRELAHSALPVGPVSQHGVAREFTDCHDPQQLIRDVRRQVDLPVRLLQPLEPAGHRRAQCLRQDTDSVFVDSHPLQSSESAATAAIDRASPESRMDRIGKQAAAECLSFAVGRNVTNGERGRAERLSPNARTRELSWRPDSKPARSDSGG